MSPGPKRESLAKRGAKTSWHQRALQVLTNWCLFAGGVSALVIGALSAFHGEATLSGIAWGAAALLLLGATIDRFESLKGLGIEAKTRQIDAKLAEADDALERIRELSELTGANLVFLHSKIGRWGGPSAREAHDVAQEVKASLTSLGSSDEKIRDALDPWVRITCGDILTGHARALEKLVRHQMNSLELRRAAVLLPMNHDDAESRGLREQLQLAGEFIKRLHDVRKLDLQTLPGSFLQLYDEAPLAGPVEVAAALAAADPFMPVVVRIRDELAMPDPERWCPAIDQLLERASRND